jgi:hypothetical protein
MSMEEKSGKSIPCQQFLAVWYRYPWPQVIEYGDVGNGWSNCAAVGCRFFSISCWIGGTLRSTDQASLLCVSIQDHANRL